MKKNVYLFLVSALGLLFACGGDNTEVVSKYPDGKPMKEYRIKWEGDNKLVIGETRYFPNGQKETEGAFDREGKKTGKWSTWLPNGKLVKEESYLADKKNGVFKDYYESGKVNFQSSYKNNVPDGEWIFYDGEGNKKSSIVFKDGKKVK